MKSERHPTKQKIRMLREAEQAGRTIVSVCGIAKLQNKDMLKLCLILAFHTPKARGSSKI